MNKLNELPSLDSSWEEIPLLEKLLQYRRQLVTAVLAIVLLILLVYKFTSSKNQAAAHDYFQAEQVFSNLTDSKEPQNLQLFKDILTREPNLHAKYDAPLAQFLIDRSEVEQALPFANRALQRTEKENQPYYSEYSHTSLLIAEKKYAEALERAINLQSELTGSRADPKSFSDLLLASNMLRIAALQNQLGLKTEELQSWKEIQKRIKSSPTFAKQLTHFQQGTVSLTTFIEARVRQLKS